MLEKHEKEKQREKAILKQKKLVNEQREKRLAEERMRQIDEQNARVKAAKLQQKDFYLKYLRRDKGPCRIGMGVSNLPSHIQDNSTNQQTKIAQDLAFLNKKEDQYFPIQLKEKGPSFFQSRLAQPSKFDEKTAAKLDALDLDLSQTQRMFNKIKPEDRAADKRPRRELDGLNLDIGYDYHKDRREEKILRGVEDRLDIEVPKDTKWLEESIRDSVAQWKETFNKQKQIKNGGKRSEPNAEMESLSAKKSLRSLRESSGQRKLNDELMQSKDVKLTATVDSEDFGQYYDEPTPGQVPLNSSSASPDRQRMPVPAYTGPGYAVIHKERQVLPPKEAIMPPKPQKKPPLMSRRDARDNCDSKSMLSNVTATTTGSRPSSITRPKSELLKSNILSREEEAQLAREKKERMEAIKKKYSGRKIHRSGSRGPRAGSVASNNSQSKARGPSGGSNKSRDRTKCTRDEDFNIEEFMREDMNAINREEAQLQRELMNLHQKNLHKHAQVLKKNKIDSQIRNTEELVKKMVNYQDKDKVQDRPKLHQLQSAVNKKHALAKPITEVMDEDLIMQSLENLDMLLANMKSGDFQKEKALQQLGLKFGVIDDPDKEPPKVEEKPTVLIPAPVQEPTRSKPKLETLKQREVTSKKSSPALKQHPSKQPELLQLKESNLQKLEEVNPVPVFQPYRQPFSIMDCDASTITKLSKAPSQATTILPPLPFQEPTKQRGPIREPPIHMEKRKQSQNRSRQNSRSKLEKPQLVLTKQQEQEQDQAQKIKIMSDLQEQQRQLQQNLNSLMALQQQQNQQKQASFRSQKEDDEASIITQKDTYKTFSFKEATSTPAMEAEEHNALDNTTGDWLQPNDPSKQDFALLDKVRVNPKFDMKSLFN